MRVEFVVLFLAGVLSPILSAENEVLRDGVSTNANDVKFYLFPNPSDPSDADELRYNDVASITNSRFKNGAPTIFYSSGFLQNRTTDQEVKNAYLKGGYASTSNIIIVDWGLLSGNKVKIPNTFVDIFIAGLYLDVKPNVNVVGKRIQEMISFLISNGKLTNPSVVHLVGQSLGAHISGMAGLYFKQTNGKSLGRISGTDPANQLFQGVAINNRLDASDAEFVDVIHTNEGGYGYTGPLGKVDFFVNGGKAPQPGCDGAEGYCSHNMAVTFFAKSILDTSLRATTVNGDTEIHFGQHCPPTASGSFYISTTADY